MKIMGFMGQYTKIWDIVGHFSEIWDLWDELEDCIHVHGVSDVAGDLEDSPNYCKQVYI